MKTKKRRIKRGEEIKSITRVVGHPNALAEIADDWAIPYVRDTCRVLSSDEIVRVLGIDLASESTLDDQFNEATNLVKTMHENIIA